MIAKLNRKSRRINLFQSREILDYNNHERREKRMLDKSAERYDNGTVIFTKDLTEEELRYMDYF